MGRMPFYEWRWNYIMGKYSYSDVQTAVNAGWYDWFCAEKELSWRLENMGKILVKITDMKKINWQTMYVWFKNGCALNYDTYDEFRFSELGTGDLVWRVLMPSEFTRAQYGASYVVLSGLNDEPVFKCSNYKSLIKWFNS